tara:strand:- start:206 stop:844 length:639 start_codon:yes stop_codon:yes gene_type:complete
LLNHLNLNYMEKELQEIKEQVLISPLTKEESKKQFIELTKQWGIKHTFDFDEAWEIGQQLRRKKDFRNKIKEVEQTMLDNPISMTGKELSNTNPVKHSFAEGCYIREIYNPANEIIITAIHAQSHPFFLLKGEMSILTHDGIEHIEAPHYGITKPGVKRVIYTHTPCNFVTVHATELTDPDEIVEAVTAETFEDPRITEEDMKLINQLKLTI